MSNKIIHPKTILNNLTFKMLHGLFCNEVKYLKKYKKLLKKMKWDDIPIKTGGYAANGSFLYYLLQIYDQFKPQRILELGSGETTKLLCRYVSENDKASSVVLEDNSDWYHSHKELFNNDRVSYKYCPLAEVKIKDISVNWFDYSFSDCKQENKFDLVIIDGPKGTNNYSRAGLLYYLLEILNTDNFIILFDDSSRKGEIETIELAKMIFLNENIDFDVLEFYGSKKQTCLCSKKYSTLKQM
ncbi:MAG: hypothetical protein ACFFDW_07725 [Candidatus Thorarchaeota archaeon]